MRYRPKNLRDENPEILNKLAKYNPYIAHVYDYPELILPHPRPDNFQEILKRINKDNSLSALPGKINIEIGCGSGRYLIKCALENPNDLFIGFELRYKRLVLSAKKIQKKNIRNILLLRERGEFIDEYFTYESIDCLHVNFPDPWPKKSKHKHRMLNKEFLIKMYPYFCSGGELRFKTDHLEYFKTVTQILKQLDLYKIEHHTEDLHQSMFDSENILTEFELLFKSKGNPPIGYLCARVL